MSSTRRAGGVRTDYTAFFKEEPLRTLAELPGEPRVEFQRLEQYDPSTHFDTVTLRYQVLYEKRGRRTGPADSRGDAPPDRSRQRRLRMACLRRL